MMFDFINRHKHLTLTLVCLLIFAALIIWCSTITREYDDIWADYYGAGTRYSHLAAFSAQGSGFGFYDINSFRYSLDSVCEQESLSGEGRVWVDSYSCENTAQAQRLDSTISKNATVTVTGGDYFLLHHFNFVSGSPNDSGADDTVVLDRKLAWELFGSDNIVGMSMLLSGQLCYISGVVEMPDGYYADFAGDALRIWIGEDMGRRIFGEPSYTSYEVYFPNPVDGFAMRCFEQVVYKSDSRQLCELTGRFDTLYLIKNIPNLAKSAARTSTIALPWWENATRTASQLCTLIALLALISLVIPATYAARLIWRVYKYRELPIIFIKKQIRKFQYDRRRK